MWVYRPKVKVKNQQHIIVTFIIIFSLFHRSRMREYNEKIFVTYQELFNNGDADDKSATMV